VRQRRRPAPQPRDAQRPHGAWARDGARVRLTRTAGARLGRRLLLAVGLAAGVLLVGRAAPAHADFVEEFCGSADGVTLQAHYEPVYNGSILVGREWTHFNYALDYSSGTVGDQNNVNIRMYSYGRYSGWRTIYEYKSPDDRKNDRWYAVVLNPRVFTSNFDHNYIGFEVIFDYRGLPDRKIFCRIEPV
jgi:hypothetical protein